jgi:hypothetical protein
MPLAELVALVKERFGLTESDARAEVCEAGSSGLIKAWGARPDSVLPVSQRWLDHPSARLVEITPDDWLSVNWDFKAVGRAKDIKIDRSSVEKWLNSVKGQIEPLMFGNSDSALSAHDHEPRRANAADISEAVRQVYRDAKASAAKPPNIKELPECVLPILTAKGMTATKISISKIGEASEFKRERRPPGPRWRG